MKIIKKIPKIDVLQNSIFVYPTETCYGLGCDALQPDLVKRIYQIKGRDFNKPVSWLIADIEMAKRYVKFSAKALKLAKKFWPCPLTLILPAKSRKPSNLWIGLRVSPNKIAQAIIEKLQGPLISTSANLSGQSECYSAEEVINQLKKSKFQPDFILDSGAIEPRLPSTVVQIIRDQIKILRQGEVIITNED